MANVYTDAGTAAGLGGTVGSAGLVQKAYDRLVEFALRSQPLLRSVADKRPARQAMPGSSVTLQIYNDMLTNKSSLTETTDPDSVALATPNQVTITLNEYGNAALVTRKLQLFSLADVDPAVANIVAYNMADSVDELAQDELRNATNIIYGGSVTAEGSLANADTLTAAKIRRAIAKLRSNKAVPRRGSMYWCGIHPEAAHDLRAETGSGSWRYPHEYQTNENIWAGEIGAFEGAFFVETPRLRVSGTGANIGSAVNIATAAGSITLDGISTATVTTASAHGFSVGDFVTIAGATVTTGVNATWQIATVPNSTSFTFKTTLSGTVTTAAATAQKKTKVYDTYIAGQQALAEAVAEEPHVVIGPVTDKLMRFRPIGWYGVLGFKLYRQEALFRLATGSSIA